MKSIKKYIGIISSLIVIIAAVIGAYEYFAHRKDLEALAFSLNNKITFLNLRIDNKIISDIQRDINRDIDTLKYRYKVKDCLDIPDDYVRKRCRSLELQLKDIEKKVDILRKKSLEGEYK